MGNRRRLVRLRGVDMPIKSGFLFINGCVIAIGFILLMVHLWYTILFKKKRHINILGTTFVGSLVLMGGAVISLLFSVIGATGIGSNNAVENTILSILLTGAGVLSIASYVSFYGVFVQHSLKNFPAEIAHKKYYQVIIGLTATLCVQIALIYYYRCDIERFLSVL